MPTTIATLESIIAAATKLKDLAEAGCEADPNGDLPIIDGDIWGVVESAEEIDNG